MIEQQKKLTPGTPLQLSARAFNTIVDQANRFERMQRGNVSAFESSISVSPSLTVVVENATGAAREAGEILELNKWKHTGGNYGLFPDDLLDLNRRPLLKGSVPSQITDRVAVLLEPAAAGELARAAISGVATCLVDMQDEAHRFARAKRDDCSSLISDTHGSIRILRVESGTGVKKAIVSLDDVSNCVLVPGTINTTSATLTFGSSPQVIEIGEVYVNLPQDNVSRIYEAFGQASVTVTVASSVIPPVGSKFTANLVLAHMAEDAANPMSAEIGLDSQKVFACDRTDSDVISVDGGGGTVTVPITAGIMSGSAKVCTIFNSDTVNQSATASTPTTGVWPSSAATKVILLLFVYASGYTGDVDVYLSNAGVWPQQNNDFYDIGDGISVYDSTSPRLGVIQCDLKPGLPAPTV